MTEIHAPAGRPLRVAILQESPSTAGDFDISFKTGLEQNGCEAIITHRQMPLPDDVHALLAYGPLSLKDGNMLSVGQQIQRLPQHKRPALMFVLTEGIPDPRIPHALIDTAARMRLVADRALARSMNWLPPRLRVILNTGQRLRILGQLQWLERNGLLTCLGVTSASRAQYLRRHGLHPIVTPLGYHPVYGCDLGQERDIDVVFLGNLDSARRKRILPRLFSQLQAHGITVNVQTSLYGRQRTRFLNRCRVVLNVLRAEQDFVGQRVLLAAANKALMVTEPLRDTSPFAPGQHLAVSDLAHLADTVREYLHDETRRSALAEQAHNFVTRELTVANMVGALLTEAGFVSRL